MNEKQKELELLIELQWALKGETFKKYLLEPIEEYKQKQKNNFFSDSLKDSWRKGGRAEAVDELLKQLQIIDEEVERLRSEIEQ